MNDLNPAVLALVLFVIYTALVAVIKLLDRKDLR